MTLSVAPAGSWPGYAESLAAARAASGHDDSVSVGIESFGGADAVVARLHFGFMGGSMGRQHGDRIVEALRLARERRLPFVSVVASGGARTQEGFSSLIQMVRVSEAMRASRAEGIPLISYFTHPTTGGIHASYGASSDVVIAEAGATIGFAGPRVVAALTGQSLAPGSHTAESYRADGLVDELVAAADAEQSLERWVRLLHPQRRRPAVVAVSGPRPGPESAASYAGWDAVERARSTERPSARQLIAQLCEESAELRGDRAGSDDEVVVCAVARLGGRTVMIVATDRAALPPTGSGLRGAPSAAGFRKARRAFALASRWRMPVVTLIDTSGADASPASDRGGLASAISEATIGLLDVPAPTVAVVVGEGGSGGAIALAGADRLLMQDDAVFEVIAPEGAAAILYRDPSRAREIAEHMGLSAAELRAQGYSDRTLPGPTTVGAEASTAALRVALIATVELLELEEPEVRLRRRRQRYSDDGMLDTTRRERRHG